MGTAAPSFPDTIVTFDAALAQVIGTMSVGLNPDTFAISDDGTTLWAGLHDNFSLLKLDVQGDTPVLLAAHPLPALPPEEFAPRPHVAGPMVVLPGTTSSLAVTLHIDNLSPSLVGVVVLDDGVPRPARVPGGRGPARLTRGPNPYLLGFNNMDGAFGVYTIEVSADGLHETEYRDLMSGFETDIVYDSGYLFGTDGSVIDVRNAAAPFRAGELRTRGPVVPRVADGVAWVLEGAESHAYPALLSLVVVSLQTFEVLGRNPLGDEVLMPRHFVASPGYIMAFIADDPEQTATGFEFESGVYLMR